MRHYLKDGDELLFKRVTVPIKVTATQGFDGNDADWDADNGAVYYVDEAGNEHDVIVEYNDAQDKFGGKCLAYYWED